MTQNNIPTHAQTHGVRAKENKEKLFILIFFFLIYHCCKPLPPFSLKESKNDTQTGVTLPRFNITQDIKSYMQLREGSWIRNLPEANKRSRLFY